MSPATSSLRLWSKDEALCQVQLEGYPVIPLRSFVVVMTMQCAPAAESQADSGAWISQICWVMITPQSTSIFSWKFWYVSFSHLSETFSTSKRIFKDLHCARFSSRIKPFKNWLMQWLHFSLPLIEVYLNMIEVFLTMIEVFLIMLVTQNDQCWITSFLFKHMATESYW